MLGWTIIGALTIVTAEPPDARVDYRPGQVWEYRTRPQDAGSLLRIQRIEDEPAFAARGPIYHISVIGVRFRRPGFSGELAHLPVSRETLDASVTRLSSASPPFPEVEPGIAEWRSARGGVFSVSVAEIIDVTEQMLERAQGSAKE